MDFEKLLFKLAEKLDAKVYHRSTVVENDGVIDSQYHRVALHYPKNGISDVFEQTLYVMDSRGFECLDGQRKSYEAACKEIIDKIIYACKKPSECYVDRCRRRACREKVETRLLNLPHLSSPQELAIWLDLNGSVPEVSR